MDYGAIISRGWQITWNNKFLWVLGFLAALGSAGGGSNASNSVSQSFSSGDLSAEQIAGISAFVVGLFCFVMILALVFWLVSLVASGGLIGAVDNIEDGKKVTLGEAFGMGTARLLRLVGMSLLLWLPVILLVIIVLVVAGLLFATTVGGSVALSEMGEMANAEGGIAAAFGIFGICLALLACIIVPISIVLNFIYPFAFRGIMLKDMSAADSIRHGWQVLKDNFVEILLLAIIFGVLGILVSAVLIVPISLVIAVPILGMMLNGGSFGAAEIIFLIGGGICATFIAALVNSVLLTWRSATFTLAYREFTGMVGKEMAVETAV